MVDKTTGANILDSTKEFLNCPICLELAQNAVECEKCNNLMCEPCVQRLKKKECPSCREILTVRPSILARRMIGSLPQSCLNDCGTITTIGNMADHLKKCANRKFTCNECIFEGNKSEFVLHINMIHEQKLIELFDKQHAKNDDLSESDTSNFDRISSKVNSA
jgi:hypothetical protein